MELLTILVACLGAIIMVGIVYLYKKKVEAEKMEKIWNRLNLEKRTNKDAY